MNKAQFMSELEYLLRDIPADERNDALLYYSDYFDEAGEDEEYVIRKLESPRVVAQKIRENLKMYNEPYDTKDNTGSRQTVDNNTVIKHKDYKKIALIICLAIVAIPIGLPILLAIVISVFSGIFAMLISIIAVGLSTFIVGGASIVVGVYRFATTPSVSILAFGIACISFAIGILFLIFIKYCMGTVLPRCYSIVKKWVMKLWKERKWRQ